jgi:DNA-binding response OmpR family regulator
MVILVVEDEPSIREVEVAYLKKSGYTTIEAANGQAAIDLFRNKGADLLLVDLNLPKVNGLEICHQIRLESNVPIIIVTAKNTDDDELRGLEAGADDYIRKPFNPELLVAHVNALLRKKTSKQLTYQGLIIDPARMIVIKDGKHISLTTTQFNLLLVLAMQPGVVLSRNQLIDQIYSHPAGHDVYDRTIDAHIKSIRKAIEDDVAAPRYISTLIGRGYRFTGKQA